MMPAKIVPSDELDNSTTEALMHQYMDIPETGSQGCDHVQPSTLDSAGMFPVLAYIVLTNIHGIVLQIGAVAGFQFPHRFGSSDIMNADHMSETETIHVMTKDMQHLVKQIQDLRHLGIEDSKIALPKICVVGDQSTGKSSLIEGMSEIKVPRSAGTCTRCPMEINLSESDQPWKCSISLGRTHTYSTKGKVKKITKTNPLGPWYSNEPQNEHFTTLKSKDLVQHAIRRAQLAILNPHRSSNYYKPELFLDEADESGTIVKFSPNVVRLDISAPGFPNLSFYDLPGVISQAEVDEEEYLVTLVENLVRQYVSQKNCIILLTLPMTDDATNSSAARIVREIKATSRTLGVLTKPDRVEDISQWEDVLGGKKFHLSHGYYVVRNNPDPRVEHFQAREEEDLFFSSSPWIDALTHYKSRLGTRNLQNALSKLLISQIKECLPHVKIEIREKIERINQDLQDLPAPVEKNTFYLLCSKLQELKGAISASLEGGSPDLPMLKIWNRIAQDFATAIHRTKPGLWLHLNRREMGSNDDSNDEEESDCQIIQSLQTSKRKSSSEAEFPAKVKPKPPLRYHTDHFQEFQSKFNCLK